MIEELRFGDVGIVHRNHVGGKPASSSLWCTLTRMSPTMSPTPTACATRRFLQKAVLDAIEKSAIAKQQYFSARAEDADSLALALRITKGAEGTAVQVLDDHIRQHG